MKQEIALNCIVIIAVCVWALWWILNEKEEAKSERERRRRKLHKNYE